LKSIIPQDDLFYENFDRIAELSVEAAGVLKTMVTGGQDNDALARKVKSLEHEADEAVHATMEHLHRTFVTPLDRSDIRHLAMGLDNILDLTDAAASRIPQYGVRVIPDEARQLALVLHQSTQEVQKMVGLLRRLNQHVEQLKGLAVEIDRLENEADLLRRTAMARLFREGGDVLELIKWKEILEYIEGATDRCEDVSDIVEGIVLENT